MKQQKLLDASSKQSIHLQRVLGQGHLGLLYCNVRNPEMLTYHLEIVNIRKHTTHKHGDLGDLWGCRALKRLFHKPRCSEHREAALSTGFPHHWMPWICGCVGSAHSFPSEPSSKWGTDGEEKHSWRANSTAWLGNPPYVYWRYIKPRM